MRHHNGDSYHKSTLLIDGNITVMTTDMYGTQNRHIEDYDLNKRLLKYIKHWTSYDRDKFLALPFVPFKKVLNETMMP
jgi:GH18 family chitinase